MLLHTIINNNSPDYLSEWFVFILQISSHSTSRGDSLLFISIPIKYNKPFTFLCVVTKTNSNTVKFIKLSIQGVGQVVSSGFGELTHLVVFWYGNRASVMDEFHVCIN